MASRISLRRIGDAAGKKVVLPATWAELLEVATRKLDLPSPAKRIFSEDGDEFDPEDFALIANDDVLYVSFGDETMPYAEPATAKPPPDAVEPSEAIAETLEATAEAATVEPPEAKATACGDEPGPAVETPKARAPGEQGLSVPLTPPPRPPWLMPWMSPFAKAEAMASTAAEAAVATNPAEEVAATCAAEVCRAAAQSSSFDCAGPCGRARLVATDFARKQLEKRHRDAAALIKCKECTEAIKAAEAAKAAKAREAARESRATNQGMSEGMTMRSGRQVSPAEARILMGPVGGEHAYKADLSAGARTVLARKAAELGLAHEVRGHGSQRHLVVWKGAEPTEGLEEDCWRFWASEVMGARAAPIAQTEGVVDNDVDEPAGGGALTAISHASGPGSCTSVITHELVPGTYPVQYVAVEMPRSTSLSAPDASDVAGDTGRAGAVQANEETPLIANKEAEAGLDGDVQAPSSSMTSVSSLNLVPLSLNEYTHERGARVAINKEAARPANSLVDSSAGIEADMARELMAGRRTLIAKNLAEELETGDLITHDNFIELCGRRLLKRRNELERNQKINNARMKLETRKNRSDGMSRVASMVTKNERIQREHEQINDNVRRLHAEVEWLRSTAGWKQVCKELEEMIVKNQASGTMMYVSEIEEDDALYGDEGEMSFERVLQSMKEEAGLVIPEDETKVEGESRSAAIDSDGGSLARRSGKPRVRRSRGPTKDETRYSRKKINLFSAEPSRW